MNITTDKLLARLILKIVRVENYSNLIVWCKPIYRRVFDIAT